jgi:hypothetical protein
MTPMALENKRLATSHQAILVSTELLKELMLPLTPGIQI